MSFFIVRREPAYDVCVLEGVEFLPLLPGAGLIVRAGQRFSFAVRFARLWISAGLVERL